MMYLGVSIWCLFGIGMLYSIPFFYFLRKKLLVHAAQTFVILCAMTGISLFMFINFTEVGWTERLVEYENYHSWELVPTGIFYWFGNSLLPVIDPHIFHFTLQLSIITGFHLYCMK